MIAKQQRAGLNSKASNLAGIGVKLSHQASRLDLLSFKHDLWKSMMYWIDFLGFSAAFCTTISFLPQAIKVFKTRDTAALSLMMYSIFTVGVILWLCYGIVRQDPAIIIANIITLGLALCILCIKIYNDIMRKGIETE